MNTRRRLFPALMAAALLTAVMAAACQDSSAKPPVGEGPAGDVALLARLGGLAAQRAQEASPNTPLALHQVDIVPGDGRYTFRFVDFAAARVISATGKVDAAAPGGFTTTTEPVTALANAPSTPIDVTALRVGPDGVVAAAVQALSAATPRTLVLTRQDGRLVWRATVNGPKGIVSGTVADETGRFVPDAP